MNRLRIAIKFINHFLTAKNTKGFGVHSPSLFHFTKFVIYNKSSYYIFSSIEEIRRKLKKDKRILNVDDFGTGIKKSKSIAEIASKSIKSAKYGQLLYRLTDYIKARNILEFGTSLGLTTSYLASSSSISRVVSLEGSKQIATIAIENFGLLNIKNIQIVTGNIDLTLSKVLNDFDQLDLVFIDANHKSTAVLNYFDECMVKTHKDSMIVVDDIYWSPDMETAWKKIKNNPQVTATIDLFQMGIVFFNPDLHKKHYKMRY
jgi:predicted O-methyltransferase YrrM